MFSHENRTIISRNDRTRDAFRYKTRKMIWNSGGETEEPPEKMRAALVVFALFSSLTGAQKPNTESNRRHDVYIAGFFPFGKGVENSDTGKWKNFEEINAGVVFRLFVVGRGVMPSVKLALDHVNEHSAVLRNYRLHMWWNDTMVRKFPSSTS